VKKITKLLMNSTLLIILFGILLLPAATTGIVKLGQEETNVLSATDEVTPGAAPQATPAPYAGSTEVLEVNETSSSTESLVTSEDEMPTFSDIQGLN
jgi:hypothetical protein